MSDPVPVVDGRRLRRERGRLAVLDATIDLILEHGDTPTVDAITHRAGVSAASVFRYAGTLDDLRRDAIARYFERFDHLIAIPAIGEGPLVDRVDRFVTARCTFYTRTAPMARLVRRQSVAVPDLAATIDRLRSTLADQVSQHFAPELDLLDAVARRHRVVVVAALTSFESWDQLDDLDDRHDALASAIHDLLRTPT